MDPKQPENCPKCGEKTFTGNARTSKGVPVRYVMCENARCDWANSEPTGEAK
jgi:hypothetical protein